MPRGVVLLADRHIEAAVYVNQWISLLAGCWQQHPGNNRHGPGI